MAADRDERRDAGWGARALRRYRLLGRNARLYLLSNLLQAATTGAVVTLYTLYLSALGYSKGFIGVALLVGTVGGGLGIIPANPLVNRLGYRAMLIWSDLIGGAAIALQILVPTSPVILVTSLAIGASVAVVFVVNTPLLAAYSTAEERTALLGLNGALNWLAGIVGTLLGGFLPEFFARSGVADAPLMVALRPLLVASPGARSLELAMLTGGLLALPSIIPILLMREQRAVAGAIARRATPPRERIALTVRAAREIAHGVIGRFTLSQVLLGFGAGLFIPFASNYFVEQLHQTTGFIGVLNAATASLIAVANLLAAWVAARFGKVRGAVIAQLASVLFLLALGAFPFVILATGAFLARSFFMGLVGPPLQAQYMESVPERSRVLASSVYNASYQIVWAIGAVAGGGLISVVGYAPTFFLAAPLYFASALLVARWFGARCCDRLAAPLPAPMGAGREGG
jgi:MFS family permease